MTGTQLDKPRSSVGKPHLLLLPALVVALSLGLTAAASAQTPLEVSVTSTQTLPDGPCPNTAYICGTANITGYGAASWNMYIGSPTISFTPCGSTNQETTYFTLDSDPSSTLVLDESDDLCGLGHDGAAYRGYFAGGSREFGHPFAIVGVWNVDPASTGDFYGLTGSGTDSVNITGAHAAGSYSGTLG